MELEDEEEPVLTGFCDCGVCASNTLAHKRAVKPASFSDCMKDLACMNYSDAWSVPGADPAPPKRKKFAQSSVGVSA